MASGTGQQAPRYGAFPSGDGIGFAVPAPDAEALDLCLFDASGLETSRIAMHRGASGAWTVEVPGLEEGQAYGFRAQGRFDPDGNLLFDPARLLADPWALRFDRPWRWHEELATLAGRGVDTSGLVPKSLIEFPLRSFRAEDAAALAPGLPEPCFSPGGLIYELNVRGFTMLHPDVPESDRGRLRALAHPSVIAHLKRIGTTAIELMPVTAWIDERHLARFGLSNAWGYNPVTFLAPDPRLAPGGIADLKHVGDRLRQEGISVILDIVFNHTGESDAGGPTLCFRGLFNREAYLRDSSNTPVNVTGTGNTIACNAPLMRGMILDALRHFVLNGGVDGFRFDLAPVLGRMDHGFDPGAPLIREMLSDPVIGSRILIAEPWDIGEGGYQLGNFPAPFLEWNDRYRDTVRRYWRGDGRMRGELATRLAGSSDLFGSRAAAETRTVNFIAAHDGFTLADLVAHECKHNDANGEENRDGHGENLSWNNGSEGATEDPAILDARRRDICSLLTTLFLSRGTIMLTAGDEMARTQHGNNNAYCQDNAITWVDWAEADQTVIDHAAALARLRERLPALGRTGFLTGLQDENGVADVEWLDRHGKAMTPGAWQDGADPCLTMVIPDGNPGTGRAAFLFNPLHEAVGFALPSGWHCVEDGPVHVAGRSVRVIERV